MGGRGESVAGVTPWREGVVRGDSLGGMTPLPSEAGSSLSRQVSVIQAVGDQQSVLQHSSYLPGLSGWMNPTYQPQPSYQVPLHHQSPYYPPRGYSQPQVSYMYTHLPPQYSLSSPPPHSSFQPVTAGSGEVTTIRQPIMSSQAQPDHRLQGYSAMPGMIPVMLMSGQQGPVYRAPVTPASPPPVDTDIVNSAVEPS